jgi:tRNA-specific 2-thiouridylase
VIDYFMREYAHGYTPNPCLECNREIKFRALLKRAEALGYEYIATGHYAQVQAAGGAYELRRGVDHDKDQSYMLYMLGQRDLARLMFPIGAYSKRQVRALAAERGLASADRPESQDICFVPGGDYRNLLREEQPQSLVPGPIVDAEGHELGQHKGLPLYTIGQRRGLGLTSRAPLYVIDLDMARNALVVGPAEAMLREGLTIANAEFVGGEQPSEPFSCLVQVRAHAAAVEASVEPLAGGRLAVRFARPQKAISPGQAAVLYAGERVIGGGRIERAVMHRRGAESAEIQTLVESS